MTTRWRLSSAIEPSQPAGRQTEKVKSQQHQVSDGPQHPAVAAVARRRGDGGAVEQRETAHAESADEVEGGSGAATLEAAGDEWKFEVAPYVWFIFLPGEITVRDQSIPVDLKFDDIWERLHFAFFLDADIRRGDFGFLADLSYAYLGSRSESPRAEYKTKLKEVIFDFAFYYEALKLDLGSGSTAPQLRFQPYVGGRYLYLGPDIRVDPITPPGPTR